MGESDFNLNKENAEITDWEKAAMQVSETSQAIPVTVDEALTDDEEDIQSVAVTKDENISRSGNRKIFLDTMLKVNNDSRHTVPNKNLINDGKLQNQQEKDKVM